MTASTAGDVSDDDVCPIIHLYPVQQHLSNMSRCRDFIIDVDSIQAHGMIIRNFTAGKARSMLTSAGVGAADITKLKANGYYTVAVGHQYSPTSENSYRPSESLVRTRRDSPHLFLKSRDSAR